MPIIFSSSDHTKSLIYHGKGTGWYVVYNLFNLIYMYWTFLNWPQ